MRIATPRVVAFMAIAILAGSSAAFGQRPERGRGGFDPRDWYSRMDTNKNGVIEPNELDDRSRGFLSRMPGIDISKPVPIDKLIEAGNQMRQNWGNGEGRGRGWGFGGGGRGGPGGGWQGGPGGGEPGGGGGPGGDGGRDRGARDGRNDERAPGENRAQNDNSNPASPPRNGFGDPNAKPRAVSGFGNSADSTPSGGGGGSDGDQRKFREYAQSLMNQHDKDKDGVLRKSSGEWDELKQEHQAADADSNGQITVDEFAAYFGRLAGKSNSSSSSGGRSNRDGGRSGTASSGGKPAQMIKSYRGKTAAERLPSGLPDWFQRNDADGDGQIMMSEYAASWTDEKVNEFNSFDLDGDGFITAKEVLKKSEGNSSRRR